MGKIILIILAIITVFVIAVENFEWLEDREPYLCKVIPLLEKELKLIKSHDENNSNLSELKEVNKETLILIAKYEAGYLHWEDDKKKNAYYFELKTRLKLELEDEDADPEVKKELERLLLKLKDAPSHTTVDGAAVN